MRWERAFSLAVTGSRTTNQFRPRSCCSDGVQRYRGSQAEMACRMARLSRRASEPHKATPLDRSPVAEATWHRVASVQRIRTGRLAPHRVRRFKLSTELSDFRRKDDLGSPGVQTHLTLQALLGCAFRTQWRAVLVAQKGPYRGTNQLRWSWTSVASTLVPKGSR